MFGGRFQAAADSAEGSDVEWDQDGTDLMSELMGEVSDQPGAGSTAVRLDLWRSCIGSPRLVLRSTSYVVSSKDCLCSVHSCACR